MLTSKIIAMPTLQCVGTPHVCWSNAHFGLWISACWLGKSEFLLFDIPISLDWHLHSRSISTFFRIINPPIMNFPSKLPFSSGGSTARGKIPYQWRLYCEIVYKWCIFQPPRLRTPGFDATSSGTSSSTPSISTGLEPGWDSPFSTYRSRQVKGVGPTYTTSPIRRDTLW